MQITAHMKYWFVFVLLSLWAINNAGKCIRHERHIEFLEAYIQENDLPTPAFPVKDGPIVFEIDVPVCQ